MLRVEVSGKAFAVVGIELVEWDMHVFHSQPFSSYEKCSAFILNIVEWVDRLIAAECEISLHFRVYDSSLLVSEFMASVYASASGLLGASKSQCCQTSNLFFPI